MRLCNFWNTVFVESFEASLCLIFPPWQSVCSLVCFISWVLPISVAGQGQPQHSSDISNRLECLIKIDLFAKIGICSCAAEREANPTSLAAIMRLFHAAGSKSCTRGFRKKRKRVAAIVSARVGVCVSSCRCHSWWLWPIWLLVLERKISTRQTREELIRKGVLIPDQGSFLASEFCDDGWVKYVKVCANQRRPARLLEETISSEILNGHATTSVTSEEVKVHIESPEVQNQEHEKEQESGTDGSEDKPGDHCACFVFSLNICLFSLFF